MSDELNAEAGRPAIPLLAPHPEPAPDDANTHHSLPTPQPATPGGSRELLKLALPLVLSQSFMTIQIAVDRVLLSRHNPDEVAASFPAVMLFWLPFGLLQGGAR